MPSISVRPSASAIRDPAVADAVSGDGVVCSWQYGRHSRMVIGAHPLSARTIRAMPAQRKGLSCIDLCEYRYTAPRTYTAFDDDEYHVLQGL